jgi:PAS domain S-box-containing protein
MLSTEDLHYRSIIERLPAGILILNRKRILFANPAFREITGYSSEDLGAMGPWDMVHPEERETIRRRGLDRLDGKKGLPERYETRWIRKDGRTIWVDVWASLLGGGNGPAILVTVVDVTDRKVREEELEHSRDMHQVLNEVLALSLEEVPLEEIFKRTLMRLLSIPWLAFESKGAILLAEGDPPSLVLKAHVGLPPDLVRACSRIPFGRCLCGRAAESQEVQFADRVDERHEICYESMTPHGHYCVPLVHDRRTLGALNLYVKEGHPRMPEEETFLLSIADTLAGVVLRLAEKESRMRSEEELRKSAERFRLFFDLAPDGVFLVDFDGKLLDGNRMAEALAGYRKEEVIGKSLVRLGLLSTDDLPIVAAMLQRNRQGDMAGPVEVTLTRKDGTRVVVEARSIPITIHDEQVVLGIARDITERKRMEEQLHRERAYLEGLFRASPDAIAMIDEEGRILQINKRFEELFHYSKEEVMGAQVDELIVPKDLADEAASLREAVLRGETVQKETRRRRKDGSLVEVSITGYPIEFEGEVVGRYVVYRDITDRLRLEAELRQAQKMEAVGRLASGVAHDFNNALTAILGYADLILSSLRGGDPLQDAAREIKKAAQRAAGITRQLLAFSRKQVIQPRVVDLNSLILEMEKMLRRLIGEDIDLVTSLAPDLGRVEVDPGQMDQVILNLAVNARDAMPRGGEADSRDGQCGAGRGVWSPSRGEGEVGALRVSCSDGHWGRDGSGCAVQDLRSFLHHQGGGDGVGSFDGLWDRQAERGLHLGLQRAGARQHIQNLFAEGG